ASNIAFLSAVARHPRFASGSFDTGFIAQEFPNGHVPGAAALADTNLFVAVAAAIHVRRSERSAKIAGQLPGHERVVGEARVVRLRDESHAVRVKPVVGGQEVTSDAGIFT